jgi:transposase
MKSNRRGLLVRHLSGGELDQAIEDAQKADKTRLVRRLCYVKNLYHGDTREEAGDRVGISRSTTHRWARAWNEAGVEGLRPGFGGGRPPKLTSAQFDELCAILKESQPWTPRAIHTLIEERYGVTYDPGHLSRKLRASGMHYAKPRPMDPRSPDNADEILAERLGEALGEKDAEEQEDDPVVLGFFDESWPQPFDNSQRMWSSDRTVTIEKPLVTAPWRSFGFYALTGKSTISFGERIIKETVCEALEKIREQNPVGRILLVADNYGSHHAKLTQERADELGIEFVFIPPYSPTLNAIEPLWKSLKREISPEIYEDEDHFREFLTKTFLSLSHRLSFAVDWIDTFLPEVL